MSHFPHISHLQHITALGGGHGLGRLLSSLAFLGEKLTGIVATTDNGGSTGRIRAQQGGIAWGDLRNCLSQITVQPTVASMLFEHRFGGNGELAGHNLGNLMLKALEDMHIRPLDGINLVRDMLQVQAHIIPMSELPVNLAARLHGSTIVGEVSVDALTEVPENLLLLPNVTATPEAISALTHADLILLGPGSFFTSIMPNLLVYALAQAVRHSAAKVVLIDNIGQEHDPSGTLNLAERIRWIEQKIGENRLDGVITMRPNSEDLPSSVCVLQRDLRADDVSYRHDREKLCTALDEILQKLQKNHKN
jgi:uncharacterized cofD-like protein